VIRPPGCWEAKYAIGEATLARAVQNKDDEPFLLLGPGLRNLHLVVVCFTLQVCHAIEKTDLRWPLPIKLRKSAAAPARRHEKVIHALGKSSE
jgi:hypothetical protein